MGIQGLLPFVRNSCRPANIKDFSGSTVAIDAYSWLHKGAFSCAEKLVKGEPTDGYVYYCMKYLNLIIEAGLTPIMVFDGCNLPSKAITEKKRRENREKTRQRGKELLCEGKVKEARECFQRCVDVTPEMAREVILACRKKSIDCIVAPYEADAQLAYLAKTGIAQFIITEDSDLILFGCSRILFKMDCNGGGLLFEKENLPKSFGSKSSKFSFEKFLFMCILSGCDYLPSLPGIGLAKAFKFFSLTANTDLSSVLPKLPSYLKMPKLTVPKEYIESFINAYNTFLYQLVFCPQKKKFVPLNPYPENVDPDNMEYAGKYLPDDVACQLAMGNINVKTMEEFDDSQSGASSVWDDTWGSQPSQKQTTSFQKESVSAFVFNSQKRKSSAFSKSIKTETATVGNAVENTCTNEELFEMYRVHTPLEEDLALMSSENLEMNSFEDNLETDSFEEDSGIMSTEDETPTSSQNSPHPRELNVSFRKIVRSRFFSPENEKSSNQVIKEKVCEESPSTENSLPEEEFKEDSNFPVEPKARSPVKENKENFRNIFAKRKVVTPDEESPSKKVKSSVVIDTIDDESGALTSTVSSSGLASKLLTSATSEFVAPASPTSFFNSRKKPKRYRTTKLSNFDWKNISSSKEKLNSSLGSDGNPCDESFDHELQEVKREVPSPVLPGEVSPFFSMPVSSFESVDNSPSVKEETPNEPLTEESGLENLVSSICDIKEEVMEPSDSLFPTPNSSHESVNNSISCHLVNQELVEEDSSDIQVVYSSTEKAKLESATITKVLKPIDNKNSMPAAKEENTHQYEVAIEETMSLSNYQVFYKLEDSVHIGESPMIIASTNLPFEILPMPEFPSSCQTELGSALNFELARITYSNSKPIGPKCVICSNYRSQVHSKRFHRFPKDPEISQKWAMITQKKWVIGASAKTRNSRYRICEDHFCDSDYMTLPKFRLKADAVPVLPRDTSFLTAMQTALQKKLRTPPSSTLSSVSSQDSFLTSEVS